VIQAKAFEKQNFHSLKFNASYKLYCAVKLFTKKYFSQFKIINIIILA